MLMITLASVAIFSAASSMRSVPLLWLVFVITALPPKPSTALKIRSSSVATQASGSTFVTCSYTRCITIFPSSMASGLAGKRVEAYRAGIMAMNFMLEI